MLRAGLPEESRLHAVSAFTSNMGGGVVNATVPPGTPVVNGTRDTNDNGTSSVMHSILTSLHRTSVQSEYGSNGHGPVVGGGEEDQEHSLVADAHEDSAESHSASPSGSKISADGCTSSGSPSSGSGSRKRKQSKTIKVDQISVKLQGNCSPDDDDNNKRLNYGDFNGVSFFLCQFLL